MRPTKSISVRRQSGPLCAQQSELNLICQRVLAARGITSLSEVDYQLAHMLVPESIRHLQQAAELLADHVEQNRSVLIFGDYDADGATSTALCMKALKLLGCERLDFLMPDRFTDGYGLSSGVARRILATPPDCVITVDNGISSLEGIALLREQGVVVIVTDHHLPGDVLPDANVIVNQNAWASETVGKNLAGVGVAFYLMLALRKTLRARDWFGRGRDEPNLANCLDLVATGTVADLVPLDYHNRILVQQGLQRIRAGLCAPGIKALLVLANKSLANVTSSDIGFAIAPRINAAGRLDDISIGVRCLLAEDESDAQALATELNQINLERKKMQTQMDGEAKRILAGLDAEVLKTRLSMVLYQAGWHEGLVGIIAARVRELYHRPSIVFAAAQDGSLKGSGRSIPGLHLRDMLDSVDRNNPGMIDKFGGHAMAAGLSLKLEKLDSFSAAFERVLIELADPACFAEGIECDGALESQYLTLESASALEAIGPWGQKFPEPSFVDKFNVLDQRVVGAQHLKLVLGTQAQVASESRQIDAIAFFQPDSVLQAELQSIHIHYQLGVNRYRGVESLQLLIRDIL